MKEVLADQRRPMEQDLMSSLNDCRPPEAKGSDDDLWGLEIFLVEDSQSVADALKQRTKVPTPTRLTTG